jgi:hypothetical protein
MPRVISQPILRFEDVLQEMQESTTLRAHDADLATNNHEIEFCFRPNREFAAGNYTLTISSRLGNQQLRSSCYEEVISFSP